jgi:DNA-binding transcriptional MerR regulator
MSDEIAIPDKPAFKAAEVCELLKLQPYVLKSWENEFKDLGVSKTPGGPRVYRRTDVERAVRIRDLVLRDGLTLAGVRRRFEQEAATSSVEDELIAEISTSAQPPAADPARGVDRERVAQVKQGLKDLLATLSKPASPVAAPGAGEGAPVGRHVTAAHPLRVGKRDLTVEADGEPSLFANDAMPPGDQTELPHAARRKPNRRTPPSTAD